MRNHEIEAWSLSIIDRVAKHQPVEDSRVELKSSWTEPESAARRLAGLANSAAGMDVLWLIGIDEQKGVTGVAFEELSDWLNGVKACFSELPPQFTELNVPYSGSTVVALLIRTDRAPFVVKNPMFGKPNGGPVALEVPWREGTALRSATRSDRLRLLSPLPSVPSFELLDAGLVIEEKDRGYGGDNGPEPPQSLWALTMTLYAELPHGITSVIPFHRCEAKVWLAEEDQWIEFNDISIRPPGEDGFYDSRERVAPSRTIAATPDEVVLHGPGKVIMSAYRWHSPKQIGNTLLCAEVSLRATGSDSSIRLGARLVEGKRAMPDTRRWALAPTV